MTRLVRYCLFAILIVLLTNGTSCINDSEPPEPPKQLDIGSKIELGSLEVGPEGGTIEVTSGKYTGIKVVIPVNAYPTKHTVRLYASPITGNTLGENVNPRSDLITFDANGVFAQANITIKVPIDVPSGEFAMGFYYDRDTKEFEGLPMASADSKSITVVTRKPGEILISSIATSKLAGVHTSGFVPGKDDWDFINEGTAQTPNGQVAGMTLSALWYYYMHTARGEVPLWGAFNSEFDNPPKLWYDNIAGIHLATQTEVAFNWQNRWKSITEHVNFGLADFTRNAVAYSILLTSKPQLVSITSDKGDNLPFIIYSKDLSELFISDANFQAKKDRKITVLGSKPPAVYSTSYSTTAYKNQQFLFLRYTAYLGVRALVDFQQIEKISLTKGTTANDPALKVSPIDGEVFKIQNELFTFGNKIRIVSDKQSSYYVDGIRRGDSIQLNTGITRIGVLTTSGNLWLSWVWLSIHKGNKVVALPVKDTGYIGDEFIFIAKKAENLGPNIVFAWYPGDGSPAIITTKDTVRIAYKKTGLFQVRVSLRDIITQKEIDSAFVSARVEEYTFSISPPTGQGIAGHDVIFSTQKRHSTNLHLRYEWNFGDGSRMIALDSNIIPHTYASAGQYNITLAVFESSSGSLYGKSIFHANVSISPTMAAILDSLRSMHYVQIGFTGMNVYRISSRDGQGPLPAVYEQIGMYAGDNDMSSARKIVWNGTSFVATWSQKSSDTSYVNGGIRTNSANSGVDIRGEMSEKGELLRTISGRRWDEKSMHESGSTGMNTGTANVLTLGFKNIPVVSANKDTITFSFSGSETLNFITTISSSVNSESQMNGGHLYFNYKNYSSTDWLNPQIPKAIVKFFK